MAFFKVKVGDKTYQLERLTLGDARVLKREFGLTDLEYFSGSDPDQMVGLLALAIQKARPGMSLADAVAEAEDIDIEDFVSEEDDEDPTSAAKAATDGAAEAKSAANGKSAKPRKTTGKQS